MVVPGTGWERGECSNVVGCCLAGCVAWAGAGYGAGDSASDGGYASEFAGGGDVLVFGFLKVGAYGFVDVALVVVVELVAEPCGESAHQ